MVKEEFRKYIDKEEFKKYIENCGGIETFVDCREDFMKVVCAIDKVIELESKVDLMEVSGEDIIEKVKNMVVAMNKILN